MDRLNALDRRFGVNPTRYRWPTEPRWIMYARTSLAVALILNFVSVWIQNWVFSAALIILFIPVIVANIRVHRWMRNNRIPIERD